MGKKFIRKEELKQLWLRALFEGEGVQKGARIAADYSRDCSNPVFIELTGTVEAKRTRKHGVHRTVTKGN